MAIEILPAEVSSSVEIHRRVKILYVEYATDIGIVRRWGWPRSGRPAKAATKEPKERVDSLIRGEGRVTKCDRCAVVEIGKLAVVLISREIDDRNSAQISCRKCSSSNTKESVKLVQNFGSYVTKKELLFCQMQLQVTEPGSVIASHCRKEMNGMISSVVCRQEKLKV